jgi:hypothetical protein
MAVAPRAGGASAQALARVDPDRLTPRGAGELLCRLEERARERG